MKQAMANHKGPKSIPSQVQLPGGVLLKGMPFRIVAYNADGSPKTFELLPVLFAREELLRSRWPRKSPSET